ncbi:hypothetical protein OIU84_002707 [Salix udensis]|uniref:Uncharacterized protein n=1 Tax=Salix udensis TaxID=889485 RepID=A0AAD6P5D3_9ROSI|nr:hypothetical protein OIU84_002707 [Salix udensis]
MLCSIHHHHHHHLHHSLIRLSRPPKPFSSSPFYFNSFHNFKLNGSSAGGRRLRHKTVKVRAFDEDFSGPLDDWDNNDGAAGYMLSSSDGEDSDGEYIINPVTDMELPTTKVSTNDSLTLTAHRLAMIGRAPPKRRNKLGTLINLGLIAFLTALQNMLLVSLLLKLLEQQWQLWHLQRLDLLDDIVTVIKNRNSGLSVWVKIFLEVAVGTCFSFWLHTTSISSRYSMKMLVPLPVLGLICLGKYYSLLTSFCFVSMGNGINLMDGLDGLAAGTAALAFVGMSIAVLPICPELAIFGASMAGACFGFLLHNRHKASVFMGDTGSLALGGALAAMAACSGMFLPLFISSGIFFLDASSVIMQLAVEYQSGFRMAPIHHHLELCGLKEPVIVVGAYVISGVLALFAGVSSESNLILTVEKKDSSCSLVSKASVCLRCTASQYFA